MPSRTPTRRASCQNCSFSAARQRPNPALVGGDAGHDQGRLHPQQQLGIHRAVALAADTAMHAVEAPYRPLGRRPVAKDHRQRRVDGAVQPLPRVALEVAVLGHAARHRWVRDLQQQRRRTGSQQHGLAVDPPHHRVRAVETQDRVCAPTRHLRAWWHRLRASHAGAIRSCGSRWHRRWRGPDAAAGHRHSRRPICRAGRARRFGRSRNRSS